MASTIEGKGGVLEYLVGGRGAAGQKARTDPFHQVVTRHVVRSDDHDAPAPTPRDPILG